MSPLLVDQTSETKGEIHGISLTYTKIHTFSSVLHSAGRSDLVACRLVWLLLKAQAEEVTDNTGDQRCKGEEGDGMNRTCDSEWETHTLHQHTNNTFITKEN